MLKWIAVLLWLGVFISSPVFAETICTFNGSVDFANQAFQLEVNYSEKSKIAGSLKLEKESGYLVLNIEHQKIGLAELSTKLESSFSINRGGPRKTRGIKGLLWTRYSLLSYKPFSEAAGSFQIEDGILSIRNLSWPEMVLNGFVNLRQPFDLNLSIEINDMAINELAPLVGVKDKDNSLIGMVSGKIRASGYLKRMGLEGRLRSREGQIKDFTYRDADMNFSGVYPKLNMVNSAISDENGYIYNLVGQFSLEEINNFVSQEHQINVIPFSEEAMRSKVWTIKREDLGRDSELEFGYRLKPARPNDFGSTGGEGILGVERKQRF